MHKKYLLHIGGKNLSTLKTVLATIGLDVVSSYKSLSLYDTYELIVEGDERLFNIFKLTRSYTRLDLFRELP